MNSQVRVSEPAISAVLSVVRRWALGIRLAILKNGGGEAEAQ